MTECTAAEDKKIITPYDILLSLCDSVSYVMSAAAHHEFRYAPMVQKISRTTLRPDIGTFVLFTGTFSGMVVINFPKEAAMEIYRGYMLSMGMDEKDLALNHTSDEVANSLGELMNQILGNFTSKISANLHSRIEQSQPKMLALPHEVQISINMALDNPQVSRITFKTEENNVFYLEFTMDDTTFTPVGDMTAHEEISPDDILAEVLGSK